VAGSVVMAAAIAIFAMAGRNAPVAPAPQIAKPTTVQPPIAAPQKREAPPVEHPAAVPAEPAAHGEAQVEPKPAPKPLSAPAPTEALAEYTSLPLAFDQGSSSFGNVDPAQMKVVVAALRRVLKQSRTAKLEIGGHTSSEGGEQFNKQLGHLRAVKVQR